MAQTVDLDALKALLKKRDAAQTELALAEDEAYVNVRDLEDVQWKLSEIDSQIADAAPALLARLRALEAEVAALRRNGARHEGDNWAEGD